MTLVERLGWLADKIPAFGDYGKDCANAMYRAADHITKLEEEVRRLQSEIATLKRPAQRAGAMQPPVQIAPTNWPYWMNETDEEFAARDGRQITEDVG